MAVIIADSNNASYDGNLSTTDGFYEVEAYNLAGTSYTGIARNAFARFYEVTFAHAGNCQGFAFFPWIVQAKKPQHDFHCHLTESLGTCTISIEDDCVITLAGHGLSDEPNSLPTGITGTSPGDADNGYAKVYYVTVIDVDTFYISETIGGDYVDTSGGTHTLFKVHATKSVSSDVLFGNTNNTYAYCTSMNYGYPFVFDTPVAVTTDASKYVFMITSPLENVDDNFVYMGFRGSTASNYCYATWCDNKISFSDTDTLICKDKVIIDQDCTFNAVLGTGYTTAHSYGISCLLLAGDDPENDQVRLEWENAPTSAYTATFNSYVFMSCFTSVSIGTEANPIPYSEKATIVFNDTSNAGNSGYHGFGYMSRNLGKMSLYFYGEIPTYRKTTLTNDVSVGATSFDVDDAVDWVAGDEVVIGKPTSHRESKTYTIHSVSGNTITLTGAITVSDRKSGGIVAVKKYGVNIQSSSIAQKSQMTSQFSNFVMSGVKIESFKMLGNADYTGIDIPSHTSQWNFTNCMWSSYDGASITNNLFMVNIPADGILIEDCIIHLTPMLTGCQVKVNSQTYHGSWSYLMGGEITFNRCDFLHYGQGTAGNTAARYIITNCNIQGLYTMYLGGRDLVFKGMVMVLHDLQTLSMVEMLMCLAIIMMVQLVV